MLELFGKRVKTARQSYAQFVADGVVMGKRPALTGGDLRRSQLPENTATAIGDYDERILVSRATRRGEELFASR
ncbi:MAG: hypothetical protein WA140_01815 [Geobacteraceae bacterium]